MAKKMLIDATHPEETRVVVVDGNKVEDFDYESINKRQLAGNIYLAKVTRVEPSLQAAFVDYGGNRHGFLAFAEIHPDYYQIPVADREALLAEEAQEEEERRAREDDDAEAQSKPKRNRRRSRSKDKDKESASSGDVVEKAATSVAGLEVIDVLEADEIDAPRGLEIAEPDPDEQTDDAADETAEDSVDADEVVQIETQIAESGEADDTVVAASEDIADDAGDTEPTVEVADEAPVEEIAETTDTEDATDTDEPTEVSPDAEVSDVEVAAADGDVSVDQASAAVVEDTEEPSTDDEPDSDAPKIIAENAGLDDDDQISEDIPSSAQTARQDTVSGEAVAEDAPVAEDTASEEASSEEAVQAEVEAQEQADPSTSDEDVTADDIEVTASDEATEDVTEPAASPDAPETDQETADPDASEATANADDATSEDVETAEQSVEFESVEAETVESSADGDDNSSDDGSSDDGDGRQKRSRRRRRRGSKKSDKSEAKPQDQDDSAKAPANGDSDSDDDDDDVESVGADDTLEEAANARVRLRRRYKIQDVIKVRQILLVQVVKEERGNKGAALTTYLSLAGRYCVLMPNTARGGGISRKITNAGDRKRLREITGELDVPSGMGLIVRTAGAERTRAEIKRDYDFLIRQWEQIRDLTLKSIAPTLIYEEGSLIKRSIRDIYSKEIDQIQVEGETGYREAKEYMKMLMPSHAKNVQPYTDPIPLFIRYQVESYLNGMFNPTVQLKSGGYIVIGVTEALVAIDVNSGRATKKGSIEETALQTNLEAADEVARQLRLRDLAGLIVIDFIDMDENRNNRAVEKRMKDRLKNDRARIQVGRISAFGLMEMSRQRLRPGMLEATTQPCPHCHGSGLIRSDDSLSLSILREVEEEGVRNRANEITVRVPIDVANFLVNQKREHIRQIEERHGISVLILGDSSMISPDYEIERAKTQTRRPAQKSAVISAESVVSDAEIIEDAVEAETEERSDTDREDGEGRSKRRRGRRGGRRKKNANGNGETVEADNGETRDGEERRGRRRRGRKGGDGQSHEQGAQDEVSTAAADETDQAGNGSGEATVVDGAEANQVADTAAEMAETSKNADAVASHAVTDGAAAGEADANTQEPPADPEPIADAEIAGDPAPEASVEDTPTPQPEPVASVVEPEMAVEAVDAGPPKPKRRGWWSLGR